jgi:hypothetical protein
MIHSNGFTSNSFATLNERQEIKKLFALRYVEKISRFRAG